MAEQIKNLKRQCASIKAQTTRIKNSLNEELDSAALNVRKTKLEELYNAFQETQFKLESVDESGNYESNLVEFEVSYYTCAETIERLLNKTARCVSANSNKVQTNTNITLPRIELPIFNGSLLEWQSFYDSFKSMVHENEEILGVQKFHYLKRSLRGEVSSVIDTLNASHENYLVAWELLVKRCNQPRKIIQMHLKSLFELSAMSKECPVALRSLITATEKHTNALKALKVPVESWNEILIYVVSTKLDKVTRRHWDRSLDDDTMPTLKEFLEFLSKFARDDAIVDSSTREISKPQITSFNRQFPKRVEKRQTYVSTQSKIICALCKKDHYIQTCDQFLKLSVEDRIQAVLAAKLCINCLRPGHAYNNCFFSKCKKCHGKHNTLLHRDLVSNKESVTIDSSSSTVVPSTSKSPESTPVSLSARVPSEVLLSTALILIRDYQGKYQQCRVLLDSASQINLITEELASRLNLQKTKVDIPLSGVDNISTRIKYCIRSNIRSKNSNYSSNLFFYTIPQISSCLPSQRIDHSHFEIPRNIPLADPNYQIPAKIDVLLGAEVFYKLLCVGQIHLASSSLTLQKTVLGWIISGSIKSVPVRNAKCLVSTLSIDEQLSKFWEIEECSVSKHMSKEEQLCEAHFNENVQRDASGRYIVRLPFNDKISELGDSYSVALKRLYALENRLDKDATLKSEYAKFLDEYQTLNHMTDISETNCINQGYYLPHHAVLKQCSVTTKLRVVFDASAKTSNGLSLNDTLLVGPTIQDDIFTLIVRFRSYNYVLTADVEKMYRQVRVHQNDALYQKILWRKSREQPIRVFRLDTVTYGTASAPFLAIRSLQQLARDEGEQFPLASEALLNDFYVDDLLTGAQTFDETIQLRDQLIKLTGLGNFHLRQWSSNDPKLLEDLSNQSSEKSHVLDPNTVVKTLGIYWNSCNDTITYSVNTINTQSRVTKRFILSKIAQLFDPLGLLGPVISMAKIIMQDLWKARITWDESVPQTIFLKWNEFQNQLPLLTQFIVPRNINSFNAQDIQLHGFCDASERAYGACIYVRSCNPSGEVQIRLVVSKSRVAPVKSVSVPRLELCAAVLLSKLYHKVRESIRLNFTKIRLWTDSTIALCWINTSPHLLKTFVANRVSIIQSYSQPQEWFHVNSLENPADAISRGQLPSEFLQNQLWLNGPVWLSQTENTWPLVEHHSIDTPELRKVVVLKTTCDDTIFERFSSWNRLIRVIAYCIRFCKVISKRHHQKDFLTTAELNKARNSIISCIQSQHFNKELENLNSNKPLDKKSRVLCLNPFIDSTGLLRVGGRLKHANLDFNQKHPILLPRAHHVTKLIIQYYHIRTFHGGVQVTLNAIRQNYWPVDGKNTTRNLIRKCVTCVRARPSGISYIMGNLPENRVVESRPFKIVGIDFCGPLFIKERKFRNRNKIKVYVAVFVCFVTKAAHLELVSDLTSEAFIASLKRFFARRGKSRHIYSDNATNFAGAKNELYEIQKFLSSTSENEKIINHLESEGISWHFSPPRSPHFGGLWEALVKSFKHHLIRTVGNQLFTYEQLNTYIIEIEAILNSRPLTPISSDPNDTIALTPAHFLIGDSLMSVPEVDFQLIPSNRLSVWQHIQKVKQHFWTRWHKEYINQLNTRSKWRIQGEQPKVGDLVIIKEDNAPSMKWPLGRILHVHPGDDGIVRVVTVKTGSGIYKRSTTRLCPLPVMN
ncbi:uncharacterized protein LOC105661897 [Megachile rotundata]|uniref:uncharacterized protein LOC105661897 n=1 Tax=Megachile rotundata TaxID=143995 RepID=UPI003FD5F9F4